MLTALDPTEAAKLAGALALKDPKAAASVFEAMHPSEAAAILGKMEDPYMAAKIISYMSEGDLPKLFESMDPAEAAEILTNLLEMHGAERIVNHLAPFPFFAAIFCYLRVVPAAKVLGLLPLPLDVNRNPLPGRLTELLAVHPLAAEVLLCLEKHLAAKILAIYPPKEAAAILDAVSFHEAKALLLLMQSSAEQRIIPFISRHSDVVIGTWSHRHVEHGHTKAELEAYLP